MKTLLLIVLGTLAACRLDNLLHQPGGSPPPSASGSLKLVFTVQPTNATAGQAIAPSVQVTAQDQNGATATSFTGQVTLALGTNPAGGRLSGTATVTAVNGVATFSDLAIDRAASGYTLSAAASSLSTVQSAAFDVVPGPATQLAFTTQPSRTTAGSPITPPVRVTAFDALGNKATNFTGVVQVTLGHDGSPLGNAQLSGSTTAAASGGVATFADLRIDQIGTGYTLKAAFGTAAPIVESAAFDVAVL